MLIIKLTKSELGVCGARLADLKTDADEGILQVSDSLDTPTLPATESPEEQAQKDISYLVSTVSSSPKRRVHFGKHKMDLLPW